MGMIKLEALVLEAKNWGEADRMLTLFTAQRGKITAVAYGARRTKSPLASAQMFNCIEGDLVEGGRLFNLKRADLKKRHKKLSEDFSTMAYGSFVAELIREMWPENVPDATVYDLLLAIFHAFETHNPRFTALAAGWQLLAFTGFEPSLECCSLCGKELTKDAFFDFSEGGAECESCRKAASIPYSEKLRRFIITLRDLDWGNPPASLPGSEIPGAENILLRHLQNVLGKPMKSLIFIQSVAV